VSSRIGGTASIVAPIAAERPHRTVSNFVVGP
jgi:hypothetical protein